MSTATAAALSCTAEDVVAALITAANNARWPDGSRMLELDDAVIRTGLAPQLIAGLEHGSGHLPGATS